MDEWHGWLFEPEQLNDQPNSNWNCNHYSKQDADGSWYKIEHICEFYIFRSREVLVQIACDGDDDDQSPQQPEGTI